MDKYKGCYVGEVEHVGGHILIKCPWNKNGKCIHEDPSPYTATLYGVTPIDCPLFKEGNNAKS